MEHENTARTVASMGNADSRPRFTPRQTDQINVALARLIFARNRWHAKPTHKRYAALQREHDGLTNLLRSIMGDQVARSVNELLFRQREIDRLPVTTRICACGQPEAIGAGMDSTTCENCDAEITRDNPEPGQDPNQAAAPVGRFEVICPRCNTTNRYPGGFPVGKCGQCDADLADVTPVTEPPPLDAAAIARAAIRVRAAQIRADYRQWSHIQIFDKIRDELRSAGDRRALSRPWIANLTAAEYAAASHAVDSIGPNVIFDPDRPRWIGDPPPRSVDQILIARWEALKAENPDRTPKTIEQVIIDELLRAIASRQTAPGLPGTVAAWTHELASPAILQAAIDRVESGMTASFANNPPADQT